MSTPHPHCCEHLSDETCFACDDSENRQRLATYVYGATDSPIAAADYVTRDSGDRQVWDTGSQRDRASGKGLPSLIPTVALRRLAGLYERGAVKYDRHNWRKGQPLSSYIDSLLRHLWLVMDKDEDLGDEDHCAAIAWNAIGLLWTLAAIKAHILPQELDDRIGALE